MDGILVPPSQSHLCWFYMLGLFIRFYLKKVCSCFKNCFFFFFLTANAIYIGRFLWDFKIFCFIVKISSELRKQLKSRGEMCIVWGPGPVRQGSDSRAAKETTWFELKREKNRDALRMTISAIFLLLLSWTFSYVPSSWVDLSENIRVFFIG